MTEQMKNEIKEHLEEENQAWGLGLIKTLEEENKELIDKLNLQNQRLNELKKENEELKWEQKQILEDNESYQKENEELKERLKIESQSLHEQCEIVSKQVEQIEKLKNCKNCKHYYDCFEGAFTKICRNKDEWELAE